MSPEDLHGRFSVGVVGRLEAELGQAKPREEQFEDANEVPQRQAYIAYYTCNL